MATEDQAQADLPTETPVVDPLDATNSTTSGTNPMSAYEAELHAAMIALDDEPSEQGDQPAEGVSSDDAGDDGEAAADEVAEENDESSDDDGEVATDDEEPDLGPKRIRLKTAEDRAIAAIMHAKDCTLAEAADFYRGKAPTKREDEKAQEAEATETVAEVSATIKDLQAQKREKLAALEFEAAAEIEEQIDELRDKRDELKVSEVQEKSKAAQKEADAINAKFHADKDKHLRFYPDAESAFDGKTPSTDMAKEIVRLNAEWQEIGDPLFTHPEKAGLLMKEAARNLGIPMRNPAKTVAKKTVTNRPMQPASGNARTTATAPAVRQEEAIDKIGDIVAYERYVASLVGA